MLILERKRGEKIMIGDEIVLTVLEIRYGSVRLGVDADPSIPVHRKEIFLQIMEERRNDIE